MTKVNRKVLTNSTGVVIVATAPLLFDKMADYYISSIDYDNGITLSGFIFSACILFLAALVLLGIQKGAAIIRYTLRNVRNEPRLENLQKRIKELRNEVIESSRRFRNSEAFFNSKVDSASQDISRLDIRDRRFVHSRAAAAHKVIGLKSIYRSSLLDLEKLAIRVRRDMDEAEKVLEEARKMADEDVKSVLSKTN